MHPARKLDDEVAAPEQPLGLSGLRPSYQLGAPISLADLLALPPDGSRYSRDEKGRLILTPPDNAKYHRSPLSALTATLARLVDPSAIHVVQEGSIAFDPVYDLRGNIVPPSHHGPKALVPDIACFARPVHWVRGPKDNLWYAPRGLRVVVELLSPSTWRTDLGDGDADDVDRWRTYLESAVPEYWIINPSDETCGLPPRSCLPLSLDPSVGSWTELPVDRGRLAPDEYRGRRPVIAGTIRSLACPGVLVDIERLWQDAGL